MKIFFLVIFCLNVEAYGQLFPLKFPSEKIPVIFGRDVISDGLANRDMAISPKGDELFYTLQSGTQLNVILYCKKINNLWTKPAIAAFSGKFGDLEPAFSPGGTRLYFTSNRPLSDTGKNAKDFDIWYVDKKNGIWGKPINMGPVINTSKDEFYASVAQTGNLYFTRDNDSLKDDIFFAAYINGNYSTPVALGEEINSRGYDFNAYIDPAENYIIFSSFKRNDDIGGGDLYIAAKRSGRWKNAVNMGAAVNSTSLDYSPFVSADKKYFFFTSRRPVLGLNPKKKVTLQNIQKALTSCGNGAEDIYIMNADYLQRFLQ